MPGASITFRMRSSNYVGTIDMPGDVIACRDVQEAVAAKLSAPVDELRIFLAGSAAPLHPGEDLPAYAVVDVVRQVSTSRPSHRQRGASAYTNTTSSNNSTMAASVLSSSSATLAAGASDSRALTEEERLAQLQAEVGAETGIDEVGGRFRRGGGGGGYGRGGRGGGYDGGGYAGRGGGGGGAYGRGGGGAGLYTDEAFRPPPPGYICHNCGKAGHLIQHCPAARSGKGLKLLSLPLGIPETMLVECTMDDPAPKFITRDHRLVKRRVDASAFAAVHALASLDAGAAVRKPSSPTHDKAAATTKATTTAVGATASDAAETATTRRDDTDGGDEADEVRLRCVVDHVLAKQAMKLPCCGRLVCQSCFAAMADAALARNNDDNSDDDDDDDDVLDESRLPRCPACAQPLVLDAVTPAHAERRTIEELLHAPPRKRARDDGYGNA